MRHSGREPGQSSVFRHHTMAGNHKEQGIPSDGTPHGSNRCGLADRGSDRAIRSPGAKGDSEQGLPDLLLERRPSEVERQIKNLASPRKILVDLDHRLFQDRSAPQRRAMTVERAAEAAAERALIRGTKYQSAAV